MSNNALPLLQDGELCTVTTAAGEREARWDPYAWVFIFTDGAKEHCPVSDVIEWVPAAKF
jgi:hypothetical protein